MRITDIVKNTRQALAFTPNKAMSAIERNQEAQKLMKFALVAGVCVLALEPSIASATTAMTGGKMTGFANGITLLTGWMTGTIAKSLAILAVVILGFMAMFGKLQMETAGKVILGIVLIFSASEIVGLLLS